ncbi:hypothetical protein BC826DRAFT_1109733 [Russula brevipes]|nr:hypothetical protein BC826DRAFT_1109733 [Russula brevipes]
MSTRNRELIVQHDGEHHQAMTALSTPPSPMTDHDLDIHFSQESGVPVEVSTFSHVITHIESSVSDRLKFAIRAPRARAAALSEIDDQIDIAKRLARSLLMHRNAFAPIFVLPPELLLRIFHAHALAEPPWRSATQTQKLGWIRVTHVCRHWRHVALNDPLLWAKISGFPTSTEWISETLDRAGNALLVVDLSGAPGAGTLSMFSSHFSHTREFRLRALSRRHAYGIREICDQEAPALEHFELELAIASPIAVQKLVRTTFFKGHAPKLRTFSLSQVAIPWSSIPLPRGQLTQLKITLIDETPTPMVGDSKQLVDLLIDCPALEILVLEFCLPSELMQFSHGKTIHLPRLSRLCIGGSSSRVAGLLNMLRPASSTTLHLCCIPEITLPHSVYLILPLVSVQFHDPAPVEFKSFRIILNYSEPSMAIIASTSYTTLKMCPSDVSEGSTDGDVELALSFEGLRMRRHWADILERACSTLPISNLEFLSICAPHVIPVANWGGLFQRCTEHQEKPPALASDNLVLASDNYALASDKIIFARLSSLTLSRII